MRQLLYFALLLFAVPLIAADKPETAPPPRQGIDLTGYRTTKDAIRADKAKFKEVTTNSPVVAGYIGIEIDQDKQGRVIIDDIAPNSPAEKIGLRIGDVLLKVGEDGVLSVARVKEQFRGLASGTAVTFVVEREGKTVEMSVLPIPASNPLKIDDGSSTTPRPILGVQSEPAKGDAGGAIITSVTEGSAAAKAGVKKGDVIARVDDQRLKVDTGLREALTGKKVGDTVELMVIRDKEELILSAKLQAAPANGFGGRGNQGGWDDRLPRAWTKPTYKLAVIGIEFPDTKHNEKISGENWEQSLFSLGTYTGKNATGQTTYGSMNDYYQEISYGTFSVSGKFLGWAEVSKKRAEYGQGTSKTPLLTEAMDEATKKFGKDALKDYDGLFILYAGGMATANRGNIYWPHRSSMTYKDKRWPYFIVNELQSSSSMRDISVFCHEFGHMLGLPDLYAQPERPGMEGVGSWCAMSQQANGGRPQHFSAWCREQLGWVKPVMVDPRIKQKLILSPIEDDPTQCIKIPVRADGSEYYLLENRRKKGFDASLPGEGLLIWRVSGGRVLLEESHGISGAAGPNAFRNSVPFPSGSNNSFTPYTTPSSKSALGGGFDIFVTNIRKLPDGRITFQIGYEFQ